MESSSAVRSRRYPQFLTGFLHAVADVISKDELIIYVYSGPGRVTSRRSQFAVNVDLKVSNVD